MSATTVAFMGALVYQFSELRPLLQEHLDDQEGELLPHLFMADVERWIEVEVINRPSQSRNLITGILNFFETALSGGEDEVVELICASFLEHLPRADQPGSELREMVGPLLAERLRQAD